MLTISPWQTHSQNKFQTHTYRQYLSENDLPPPLRTFQLWLGGKSTLTHALAVASLSLYVTGKQNQKNIKRKKITINKCQSE